MSGIYTEADYENTIIELFENMGWSHVYGPDIERDYSNFPLEKCCNSRWFLAQQVIF